MGRWRVGLLIGFPAVAWAGETFDEEVVFFAPVGPVRGGETVVVHLLALDADGAPRTGAGGIAIAGGGTASTVRERGDGWYEVTFTADPDASAGSLRLRGSLSGRVPIPIVPTVPARLNVEVDPPAVVAGTEERAEIRFTMPGFPPAYALHVRSSSGELSPVRQVGDATWSLTFTPPSTNYPHLALVTGAIRGGVAVGGGAVAVHGAVPFPVQGPPGAEVTLTVAGERFGPVTLDGEGRGAIPIEVPPGVREGVQRVVDGDRVIEGRIDLRPPVTRRMAWVPSPGPIPVGEKAELHLLVFQPDGAPDEVARPSVEATGGTVRSVRHVGGGLYAVDYRARGEGGAAITARLAGDVGTATLGVRHLPARPPEGYLPTSDGEVAAVLLFPPTVVVGPEQQVETTVLAVDRYGYPIPGVELSLRASRGRVPERIRTGEDGAGVFVWTGDGSRGGAELLAVSSAGVEGRVDLLVAGRPLTVELPPEIGMRAEWARRLRQRGATIEESPEEPPVAPVEELPELALPVEPSEPGLPWIRAQARFQVGSYRSLQVAYADPGPLLPGQFGLGGYPGSKRPSVQGLALDLRAWPVRFLGLRLVGSAAYYRFRSPSFSDSIQDGLLAGRAQVAARLPLSLGGEGAHPTLLWVNLFGGVVADDFLVFQGCGDPGCTVEYDTVVVNGGTLGLELGLEWGRWFGSMSGGQSWAYFDLPYRMDAELEIGREWGRGGFVTLGLASVKRNIGLEGARSGQSLGMLDDARTLVQLGGGFQF